MVLDPVSAVGLAGSIVQFVEFASKLISKTYEYHNSLDGTLAENREKKTIASSLDKLTAGLEGSLVSIGRPHKWSETEISLQQVSGQCCEIAVDLHKALMALEPGRSGGGSFKASEVHY